MSFRDGTDEVTAIGDPCGNCDDGCIATIYCDGCDDNLCEGCYDEHQNDGPCHICGEYPARDAATGDLSEEGCAC